MNIWKKGKNFKIFFSLSLYTGKVSIPNSFFDPLRSHNGQNKNMLFELFLIGGQLKTLRAWRIQKQNYKQKYNEFYKIIFFCKDFCGF